MSEPTLWDAFAMEDTASECVHGEPRGAAYCALCRRANPALTLPPEPRTGRARSSDPSTSKAGAVAVSYRANSQKARLLQAFVSAGEQGRTDEEAAMASGVSMRSCFWKRCSELREDGMIEDIGITRAGDAGVPRMVCRVTNAGRAMWMSEMAGK